MAVTVKRVRRLVNPTRRKTSPAQRKRRTPAQQAATRRMLAANKRHRRSTAKPKAKKTPRRKNSAVVSLGLINPRKGTTMTKHKPRRKPAKKAPRRSNPSPTKALRRGGDVLKTGAFALGGLVLTRQIPQAIFASRNHGFIGYLMNIVVAIAAAAVVTKVSGKPNGQAVAIGGGLYTVERILSEQLTPLGKALSLSGVGDARAHGGLAGIRNAYFPWPVTRNPDGSPHIPREIIGAARPLAAPAAGVGRYAGRF